ncbi:ZP domain-containing protein-like [Xenia sp. Carnegie-2017]|uniref:ZP domain-containing protein-like n=1 Tax=Xenia sp. Carnegie-2017 TaxID=2897299 RepID=UPI001F0400BF|nr:ZP domain-containing protein-like [Xenia sp. Carnegie-2017]
MFKLIFLLMTVVVNLLVNKVSSCPSDWIKLQSSCYFFSTTQKTWHEARRICQQKGGDLAVPKNKAENDAIYKFSQRRKLTYPSIGLFRNKNDNKFYTVHNVAPTFINWIPGEPNNARGKEDCVHFYTVPRKWNDISCSIFNDFICQKSEIHERKINYKLICGENNITFWIKKSLLNVTSASQLQLSDNSCKPKSTKLYFIFTTSLTRCGTKMTVENGGKVISFHNKIIESFSGFNSFKHNISREKEIQFPFKCSYPHNFLISSSAFGLENFTVENKTVTKKGQVSIVMSLYTDELFSQSLTTDPSMRDRLYVEVKRNTNKTNSTVGIKLNKCFVTSKSSSRQFKYVLIERG